MRRLAFILVLLSATACFGQQVFRVQKFCEVGGQKVITQGLNSVTNIQRSFPKCTVTVYLTGTTTIAAVYSDNLGPPTPLANPFTANVDGSWGFYASTASCYDVVTSGGNPGDTFPQPFTYSNICAGGGGGGTGVNPGTPYQVTRYDPTGVNIQDSTGSDNPANGPTRWTQGLSVEGNAGYRMFVNSSAGTTTNLLVCRDASVTSITEVTTCPVSSNSVFGLADNGSGVTGNVRVAMTGFHSCVFDGQTVVGDWAVPSATNAGQCSDGGATKPTTQQVLGHITTLNTGAATLATVDLWTGDTISGGGALVAIAPCVSTNCNAFYPTTNSIAGDVSVTDDGAGKMTMKAAGFTDTAHSGFWYETAGPNPTADILTAAPASSTLFYVDSTIATPNSFKLPKAAGAADVGKAWGVASNTTDVNGNPVDIMGMVNSGGAEFQTNTVDNANCTAGACPLLDIDSGTNTTVTNTSAGHVRIDATGGLPTTQIATPTAPTLSTNGSAGSTSRTYAIVGCEDVACVYHTPVSSTTTIATTNATLTSGNSVNLSVYGDTLYGPRCFNVYRTASAGTPSTTGLIAACVGKKFIDTGLAGDGTTAPVTNTTILTINMSPNPGCNIPPNGIIGVDAPPCSTNALDDEMGATFGTPADANSPFWTILNSGSGATSWAWSGGAIIQTNPLDAGNATGDFRSLYLTAPSTPYTFVAYVSQNSWTSFNECGIGFEESATNKYLNLTLINYSTAMGVNVASWLGSPPTSHSDIKNQVPASPSGGAYLKIQNTGTNLVFSFSTTGDGIGYEPFYSESKTSHFTTGPDRIVIGGVGLSTSAGPVCDFDYVRRTQ